MREMKLTAVINFIVLILNIRFKSNIRDVAINPFQSNQSGKRLSAPYLKSPDCIEIYTCTITDNLAILDSHLLLHCVQMDTCIFMGSLFVYFHYFLTFFLKLQKKHFDWF